MNVMFGHRELPANELSLHVPSLSHNFASLRDHFTIRDGIDGLIRHVPKKASEQHFRLMNTKSFPITIIDRKLFEFVGHRDSRRNRRTSPFPAKY